MFSILKSVKNVRHFKYRDCSRNICLNSARNYNSSLPEDESTFQLSKSHLMSRVRNYSLDGIIFPKDEKSLSACDGFEELFPEIVKDMEELGNKYANNFGTESFKQLLEYNVPKGKKNRGKMLLLAFDQIAGDAQKTPENIRLAQTLAWVLEMLTGSLLICDDIIDAAEIRRGQKCWHRLENVGLQAINDSVLLENGAYCVLQKNFGHLSNYIPIFSLLREMTFITMVGQLMDCNVTKANVSTFNMELYKRISRNKTSYGTVYLPVALAMHVCGYTDPKIFQNVEKILLELGNYYQVENDFQDCFGDPVGKFGRDIEDNKCTWLAVVCMERASDNQKEIMMHYYGKDDPESAEVIKDLYRELDIQNVFAVYEKESFNYIKNLIDNTTLNIPSQVYYEIWKLFQKTLK